MGGCNQRGGDWRWKKGQNNTNKKHKKEKKKSQCPQLFRELFVWHTELAVFRNNVLIKCNWYLPTESFGLQASTKAASSMGAALWKLQPSVTGIRNTYLANSTSLPCLARLISFWRNTAVRKYWEINLAGFTGNMATDKHKRDHADPSTYLAGFSIKEREFIFITSTFNVLYIKSTLWSFWPLLVLWSNVLTSFVCISSMHIRTRYSIHTWASRQRDTHSIDWQLMAVKQQDSSNEPAKAEKKEEGTLMPYFKTTLMGSPEWTIK